MLTVLMFVAGFSLTARAEPQWISYPSLKAKEQVVLHFRREINIDNLAKSYPIDISADNRYVLYVNGQRVAEGPSRSDLKHWRYRSIDLRPYLNKGKNIIAVEVWNIDTDENPNPAPLAQISTRTGLWLRGKGNASVLETNSKWRVSRDLSRSFISPWPRLNDAIGGTYYVAGSSEIIKGSKADWIWNGKQESKFKWVNAVPALNPSEAAPWTLEADKLPRMSYKPIKPGSVVRTDLNAARSFPNSAVTIPANTSVTILIDQTEMISAYPTYGVSGGKGSEIKVTYSEALYDNDKNKGDRNSINNRIAHGVEDIFLPDGQKLVNFRPLWWRTWRYMQIQVKTSDQPLKLDGIQLNETGYPFKQLGYFKSDDADLNKIWEIGWRTLRINAHETFMDSSYWEQLQYVGDTRIESLIALTVSGDPRLTVQAIDAFGQSQNNSGMIQSAYPSRGDNIIPPFGLYWIGMMSDYAQYQPETAVLKRNLIGARKIFEWYEPYIAENGLIGMTPYWNYIDWAGEPQQPGENTRIERFPSFDKKMKTSCVVTLNYLGALKDMATIEMTVGSSALAEKSLQKAEKVRRAIQDQCWDPIKGLYADSPDRTVFSQHANALAVLYDVAPKDKSEGILKKITNGQGVDAPPGIIEASYYFSWYLIRAFDHAGLDAEYLNLVKTWRDLLKQNFTTWPETRGKTRSDTHAWSAHPTTDLIGFVAGIKPDATGYRSAIIAPHLGNLKSVDAAAATPKGVIKVSYRAKGDSTIATISIPRRLTAKLVWNGKTYILHDGINKLNLKIP